jgi:hypothetical protein
MILLYMLISLAGFAYIYYHTAKPNIDLSKGGSHDSHEEKESFENSPKNENSQGSQSNYNTQKYAYSQPQHNDRRDINRIFNTQPLTPTPFLKTGHIPVSYASDTIAL